MRKQHFFVCLILFVLYILYLLFEMDFLHHTNTEKTVNVHSRKETMARRREPSLLQTDISKYENTLKPANGHDHTRKETMVARDEQALIQIHNISCERIIKGDRQYMKTLSFLSLSRRNKNYNETNLPQSCDKLLSTQGYQKLPVTDEELDFPLAFALKIHKDPFQVLQILRAIYRPHNVYCIHVDLKSEEFVVKEIQRVARCLQNVFVIQKVNVVYTSIGLLKSDIVCMEELMEKKVKWKYYINLCGQEFPLKTNLEIVQILKLLKGKNDIESFPFPVYLYWRFETRFVIRHNTLVNLHNVSKLPFRHKIHLNKGSMYGMFTRNFVHFVLTSAISKDLITWASDTYAPEELVWATLNALPGTPGGYNLTVKHDRHQVLSRAIIWNGDNVVCHGFFYRSICILSYKDLPWLTSAPEVIANKFHSTTDQLAIDCLEEWLHNKTMLGTTVNLNWFYYRNVPHVNLTN